MWETAASSQTEGAEPASMADVEAMNGNHLHEIGAPNKILLQLT